MQNQTDVGYDPPASCTASLRSIITNHFGLIRLARTKQRYPEQITDEILFIVRKVNETADKPKETLAQLGLIIFPGVVAIKRRDFAKLLSICKVGLATKMQKADWSVDIMFPSIVKQELKKIVGDDFRSWMLRGTPRGCAFDRYIQQNPELISARNAIASALDEPEVPSSPIINYAV